MTAIRPVVDAFRGEQRKPTLILLTAPVLMLAWKYLCAPASLARVSAGGGDAGLGAGAIGSFVACFFLLGVLPAAIVRLVFRERLADYGVGQGIPLRTWRTLAVAVPIVVALAWASSRNPAIRAAFPINPRAGDSAAAFAVHAAAYLLYYLGWEFYFRGFLLFGLRPAMGDANAVLVQCMASALLHIGSPAAETFGSILGGLLWGVLALRTRSLLSGLGQHFLLGVGVDAFICLARR